MSFLHRKCSKDCKVTQSVFVMKKVLTESSSLEWSEIFCQLIKKSHLANLPLLWCDRRRQSVGRTNASTGIGISYRGEIKCHVKTETEISILHYIISAHRVPSSSTAVITPRVSQHPPYTRSNACAKPRPFTFRSSLDLK